MFCLLSYAFHLSLANSFTSCFSSFLNLLQNKNPLVGINSLEMCYQTRACQFLKHTYTHTGKLFLLRWILPLSICGCKCLTQGRQLEKCIYFTYSDFLSHWQFTFFYFNLIFHVSLKHCIICCVHKKSC